MPGFECCTHHETHTEKITRNKEDIQDIFTLIEKGQDNLIKVTEKFTEKITASDIKSTEANTQLKVEITKIVAWITAGGVFFGGVVSLIGALL